MPESPRREPSMDLRLPVFVLVVAFTALPVSVRPFDLGLLATERGLRDIAANVLAYLPVGAVLGRIGWLPAVALATALTGGAELGQFVMEFRFPSPVDAAANLLGAVAGWALVRRFGAPDPLWKVGRRSAGLAGLLLAAGLSFVGWWSAARGLAATYPSDVEVNPRGATVPGTLEARWSFDVPAAPARAAPFGPDVRAVGGVTPTEGVRGGGILLDGADAHLDLGAPTGLRLVGSLTLTAWVNPSAHPEDDGAIVSAHTPGYQLDTTVDTGTRVVGFKLVDACGNTVARYGRTELALDRWYHVAGVYDADARAMHVYLDGRPDDGPWSGAVTAYQQPSTHAVLIGRRPDPPGFGFAGRIDDVRIYSRALGEEEIRTMAASDPEEGDAVIDPAPAASSVRAGEVRSERLAAGRGCAPRVAAGHVWIPGFAVALGMLAAVVGVVTRRPRSAGLALGAGAGLAVAGLLISDLPGALSAALPAASVLGAVVVLRSYRAEARGDGGAPPPGDRETGRS